MSRLTWLVVVAAALAGLGAGLAVNLWIRQPAPVAPESSTPPAGSELVGSRRPDFALPDRGGDERAISAFDGEVVLLNFWASWCGPCREEVPALVAAQRELGGRGLRVVGVALDDPQPVREFADEHGINYPVLLGSGDGFQVAREYGNARGALPYTVIIDRDGVIRETHLGALTRSDIMGLVEPLL